MSNTPLTSHKAATCRNGADNRVQPEAARTALVADIRSGIAAHATEIRSTEERISDVALRLVHHSAKAADVRALLPEAVELVQRIAGGRTLLPFLADAADAAGSFLRLMLIARILAAMHLIARDGRIPSPLTSEMALVMDVLQERG